MPVHEIDPARDARWEEFLTRHPEASAFHSTAYLGALRRTYGYHSLVLTTTPPGEPLRNGLVFCKVKSWITGHRLVSIPFADHCEPLVSSPNELAELLNGLHTRPDAGRWKYIELRPLTPLPEELAGSSGFAQNSLFFFHKIDLRSGLDVLFRRLHKTACVQMIQRAERENLIVEAGNSSSLLREFFSLLLLTRRRHQLPPQPMEWFRNLIDRFGEDAVIRVARKDGQPVAAIFTVRFKKRVVYKYGCSDAACHNLGGIPLLIWEAICDASRQGVEEFDMGRSEPDNSGLIKFKDRWGAICSELTYRRYSSKPTIRSAPGEQHALVGRILAALPDVCFAAAGRLLYKHVG